MDKRIDRLDDLTVDTNRRLVWMVMWRNPQSVDWKRGPEKIAQPIPW